MYSTFVQLIRQCCFGFFLLGKENRSRKTLTTREMQGNDIHVLIYKEHFNTSIQLNEPDGKPYHSFKEMNQTRTDHLSVIFFYI